MLSTAPHTRNLETQETEASLVFVSTGFQVKGQDKIDVFERQFNAQLTRLQQEPLQVSIETLLIY